MFIFDKLRFLGKNDFPDILVCPVPAFDTDNLKYHGYHHSFDYFTGSYNFADNIIGWNGRYNWTNVEDVRENVSLLKSKDDCPTIKATFLDGDEKIQHFLKNNLIPNPFQILEMSIGSKWRRD